MEEHRVTEMDLTRRGVVDISDPGTMGSRKSNSRRGIAPVRVPRWIQRCEGRRPAKEVSWYLNS